MAFEDSRERSKRRKSKDLRKTFGSPELTHATNIILQSASKTLNVLFGALETTPKRTLRNRKVWAAHTKNVG